MKKAPFTDDYGGNHYGKQRGRTRTGDGNHSSFKCDECGSIRYVTSRELARAFKPRCLRCGGVLIETDAEAKRHKQERRPVSVLDPERRYRCRNCGVNLGGFCPHSLIAHLRMSEECRNYYVEEQWVFPTEHETPNVCIFGTSHVVRHDHYRWKWKVVALDIAGELITVCLTHTRTMAEKMIVEIHAVRANNTTE